MQFPRDLGRGILAAGIVAAAVSTPASVLFLMGTTHKNCAYAQIRQSLSTVALHHSVAFDAMYGAPDGGTSRAGFAVVLHFLAPGGFTEYLVHPANPSALLLEQTVLADGGRIATQHSFASTAPLGRFAHYEVEVDFSPASPNVVLRIDNSAAPPSPLNGRLMGPQAGALHLGLNCVQDADAHEIRLDNVVYRAF